MTRNTLEHAYVCVMPVTSPLWTGHAVNYSVNKILSELEDGNPWFTQVMEKLENLEMSWKKILSGKVMEMSWKNDQFLEKWNFQNSGEINFQNCQNCCRAHNFSKKIRLRRANIYIIVFPSCFKTIKSKCKIKPQNLL